MPQRSPQQENHTPVIGIALTLLLSIALATGCSASTAGNEAPPANRPPSLRARGRPTARKNPRVLPQRIQTSRKLRLLAKIDL